VTDKRYSLVVVGLSVALAVGIAFFALGTGLFLGYQWGKSAGKAEAIKELPGIGARGFGPLLEELFPGGELPRQGLDQFIPRGDQDEFQLFGRPFLGVTYQMITSELQEQESLDEEHGALIVEVVPGSPADDAGLQEGDIIHAVDGAEVNENHHLAELIGSLEPGEQVELTVIRNGRRITVEVELGTRPGGSSLEGDFLGQMMPFLGEMMPGFQFQGELPEGFRFEFPCGDETCRFPEGFEHFEGFEELEGFEG
jgi:membrane-associated protease RseP (regulator of RpoE activity)